MKPKFKFRPIQYSWVAIHPHPIGVVNFIGGAFFGSLPTVFYRYLIRQLFDAGYTVIVMPFSFTFQHWGQSIQLFTEWRKTVQDTGDEAQRLGYDHKIYQLPDNPDDSDEARAKNPPKATFFWLGHSLGTKYIALLEYLSELDFKDAQKVEDIKKVFFSCNRKHIRRAKRQFRIIENALRNSPYTVSIFNQPSLLLAPDISDTQSAIRIPFLAKLLDALGLGVEPTKEATFCLIQKSDLYQLMALIAFEKDKIARKTVEFLKIHKLKCENVKNGDIAKVKCTEFPCGQLPGGHLQPMGFRRGDRELAEKVIDYLRRLANSKTFSKPT